MPRIDADTVVEHVDRQQRRVFEAAVALFTEKGYEQVTFGDIAEVVGLARNSLYRYFPSKAAILARWMEAELDESIERTDQILKSQGLVTDRINAWAKDQIDYGRRPEHALLVSFASARDELDTETLGRLQAVHSRMNQTLIETIRESGSGAQSDLIADLIFGMVNRASSESQDRDEEMLPLLFTAIEALIRPSSR